jgi:hypothetical protein
MTRRGFGITCVELGESLAAAARRNLAGFDVRVEQARFEDFPADEPVALVYAATAWHWIDPASCRTSARRSRRAGGSQWSLHVARRV